eukprot:1936193-Pleurochrysis_carterae.AAC.1
MVGILQSRAADATSNEVAESPDSIPSSCSAGSRQAGARGTLSFARKARGRCCLRALQGLARDDGERRHARMQTAGSHRVRAPPLHAVCLACRDKPLCGLR